MRFERIGRYEVAANCFGCHTVPHEEIVNVANHTTGGEFELVERSQGTIRHNFLESLKTGDGTLNAERPPEWKRLLYVAGRALDFEYSLRGVAAATVEGRYLDGMSGRVGSAFDALAEMTDFVPIPEIDTMFQIYESVDLVPNNVAALTQAADQVREATQALLARSDGTELAGLDLFWDPDAPEVDPPPRESAPEPAAPVAPEDPGRVADAAPAPLTAGTVAPPDPSSTPSPAAPDPPPGQTPDAPPSTATPDPANPPPPASQPAAAAVRYDVQPRPAWRDPPSRKYVKGVPCGNCHEHAKQTGWWEADPHSDTIEPFKTTSPETQAIARAYGLAAGDIRKGAQTCMWCHGTITSSPRLDVRNSVGCQMCHGAGKDYEKSHEMESYADSLAKGMTDLKDAPVRAQTCAGCHLITDPGLLAAGHASGDDFDIAERMSQITHWGPQFGGEASDISGSTLTSAYASVLAARPVPRVTPVATAPQTTSNTTGGTSAASAAPRQAPSTGSSAGVGTAPRRATGTTSPSPADGAPARGGTTSAARVVAEGSGTEPSAASDVGAAGESGGLSIADDTPIERILLRMKEHLEALYEQLGRDAR